MTKLSEKLHMAKHIDTITSKDGSVIKYVFEKTYTGTPYILEVTYIDRKDGRNIICVPTQSMCNMGCKFCHTTDYIGKIPVMNIDAQTLVSTTFYVMKDLRLINSDKVFLLSFMGCGEPLENMTNVLHTINDLSDREELGSDRRFAIATSIPRKNWLPLLDFADKLSNPDKVKLHFSMHYTTDEVRKKYMPKAMELDKALKILDLYKAITGSVIEVHYTLMDGINDTMNDLYRLGGLLKSRDFQVKLLYYNKREALDAEKSPENKVSAFKETLETYNISTTYYIPPGLDVGASCGQFLMDHYIKAESNKE